jgi:hypothetical protein
LALTIEKEIKDFPKIRVAARNLRMLMICRLDQPEMVLAMLKSQKDASLHSSVQNVFLLFARYLPATFSLICCTHVARLSYMVARGLQEGCN